MAFSSAQRCTRREMLGSRGLKAVMRIPNEETVLHSSRRATNSFVVAWLKNPLNSTQFSGLKHPLTGTHVSCIPHVSPHAELCPSPERNNVLADGSPSISESVPSSMEHCGVVLAHARPIVTGEAANTSYRGAKSFHDSSLSKGHQEASAQHASKSLPKGFEYTLRLCSTDSSHPVKKQRLWSLLLVSPQELPCPFRMEEKVLEDVAVPSTPDLQPEVRPWACQPSESMDVSSTSGSRLERASVIEVSSVACTAGPLVNAGFKRGTSSGSSEDALELADKQPTLLEKEGAEAPLYTESYSKSHNLPFLMQESNSLRIETKVDDCNILSADQSCDGLDTCLLLLRPPPLPSPPQNMDVTVSKMMRDNQEIEDIKCSHGRICDESHGNHLLHPTDGAHDTRCLPTSLAGGPCVVAEISSHSTYQHHLASSSSSMVEEAGSVTVQERQSRERLQHFADVFLLRRHIMQQQRRAQQAPPYRLPGGSQGPTIGKTYSRNNLFENRDSNSSISMPIANMKPTTEDALRNYEPVVALASSLRESNLATNPCSQNCFESSHFVVDIIELLKFVDVHFSQVEAPSKGGESVLSNVRAVMITIIAIVVYTKVLCQGVLARARAHPHNRKEEDKPCI